MKRSFLGLTIMSMLFTYACSEAPTKQNEAATPTEEAEVVHEEKEASTIKFLPPEGKQLLILGQDLGAVGGFEAPDNDGYFEHIKTVPGGITTYTSFPTLYGLAEKVNYGSGNVCGTCIVDNQHYKKTTLAIGLYLVDQLEAIAGGLQDSTIKALGEWIKASQRPVFLRIGYEFDGMWNHYDPELYKKSYIRIVDMFREMEVENCAYVWQACTSPIDDILEAKHENILDWYPGDEYVDWMAYSWFLNNEMQIKLTDEVINLARERNKPVMVAEAACQSYDTKNHTQRFINTMLDGKPGEGSKPKSGEEIWNEWFVPYFDYIKKNKDVVRAVAYINVNWDAQGLWGPPYDQGYWGDTRVENDEFVKGKWIEETSKENWLQSSDQLFEQLGYK